MPGFCYPPLAIDEICFTQRDHEYSPCGSCRKRVQCSVFKFTRINAIAWSIPPVVPNVDEKFLYPTTSDEAEMVQSTPQVSCSFCSVCHLHRGTRTTLGRVVNAGEDGGGHRPDVFDVVEPLGCGGGTRYRQRPAGTSLVLAKKRHSC